MNLVPVWLIDVGIEASETDTNLFISLLLSERLVFKGRLSRPFLSTIIILALFMLLIRDFSWIVVNSATQPLVNVVLLLKFEPSC